jgi:intracellular septation protein
MSASADKPAQQPLVKLALDLGPLIVFFVGFFLFGIYGATAAFMVAVLTSLALGYMRERKLSPMPLFTAALVVVFGGLTLYLKNDTFIKMKPTVLYAFIGMLLLGGLAFNRLFIKYVFAQAFDLSEQGWRKLTWRWALFALALAIANEVVWRNYSNTVWVLVHVWVFMALTFLFALAQTPLVLRHGNPTASEQDRDD